MLDAIDDLIDLLATILGGLPKAVLRRQALGDLGPRSARGPADRLGTRPRDDIVHVRYIGANSFA